jgi:hypothetical protein
MMLSSGSRRHGGGWEGTGIDPTAVEAAWRRDGHTVWTRRWLGRRSVRCRCGPDGGGGGEERARGPNDEMVVAK